MQQKHLLGERQSSWLTIKNATYLPTRGRLRLAKEHWAPNHLQLDIHYCANPVGEGFRSWSALLIKRSDRLFNRKTSAPPGLLTNQQEHITEVPYSADVPAIASGSRSLSAQLARNRARWNFGECYDNNNPTLPKSVFAWMTSHAPSL